MPFRHISIRADIDAAMLLPLDFMLLSPIDAAARITPLRCRCCYALDYLLRFSAAMIALLLLMRRFIATLAFLCRIFSLMRYVYVATLFRYSAPLYFMLYAFADG